MCFFAEGVLPESVAGSICTLNWKPLLALPSGIQPEAHVKQTKVITDKDKPN